MRLLGIFLKHMCVGAYVYECRGLGLTSEVSLDCFPVCTLRQVFLWSPELTDTGESTQRGTESNWPVPTV